MNNVSTRFRKRAAACCALIVAAVLLSAAPGLGQMLGTPSPGAAPASGLDYRDPAQAPPSWAQFAKLVKYRFETWMAADEPVANRFRSYVIEHAGKNDGKNDGVPPTLVVKAWLNPDGSVEKVSFPSLNDPHADDDLRAILKRGNVGEAPPPEMLQPLNLRFSLNLKK
jgi:hypothetical protein